QTPTHNNTEVPSIRLVSATPSSTSTSMSGLTSPMLGTSATPWDEMPPPPPIPKHHLTSSSSSSRLRPKATRLVPKKSKLRMLGSLGRDKQDKRDFSDVVRRVAGSSKLSLRGGFEIYVEPAGDPEMEDVVVVKKGRGRGALEGVGWGPKTSASASTGRVLGDVDMNTNGGGKKEGGLKVKGEEGGKWWSIGRGRRDSKEDKKEKAREKDKDKENGGVRSQSTFLSLLPFHSPLPLSPILPYLHILYVLTYSPDPFKTPTPTEQPRTRFNSLDAGILLGLSLSKKKSSVPPLNSQPISSENYFRSVSVAPSYSRSATPTMGGLLAPPSSTAHPNANANGGGGGGLAVPGTNASNSGSIAVRAMRSVRSIARLGSWGGKLSKEDVESEFGEGGTVGKSGGKEKKGTVGKKSKKEKGGKEKEKEKEKEGAKEKDSTIRTSISSFEAGHLSSASPKSKSKSASPNKKHSILGLGLPSAMSMSMRMGGMRSGSSASSVGAGGGGRLSVDSHVDASGRRGSIQSTASSLRPVSITSTISGVGVTGSAAGSVRWDEEGLERARKEVRGKRESIESSREGGVGGRKGRKESGESGTRGTKRSVEGRRRKGIVDIFPEIAGVASRGTEVRRYPIVTIEEATADGHGEGLYDPLSDYEDTIKDVATPVKKPRGRPVSEQLLGRARPEGVCEDEDGVLSILSAATNDLAQLINNLDLEATPATPDVTPLRPSLSPFSSEPSASSTGLSRSFSYNGTRSSAASISSLRPYAQARSAGTTSTSSSIGSVGLSPVAALPPTVFSAEPKTKEVKEVKAMTMGDLNKGLPSPPPPGFVRTHKRTITPAREEEPIPVFAGLKPNPRRQAAVSLRNGRKTTPTPERVRDTFDCEDEEEEGDGERFGTVKAKGKPSEFTFGSLANTTSKGSKASLKDSSASSKGSKGRGSVGAEENRAPMSREARRLLGMSGTMGGSDASAWSVQLDESDPDSDVPEELRSILKRTRSAIDGETIASQDGREMEEEESESESEEDCSAAEAEIQQAQRVPVFRAQLNDGDTMTTDCFFDCYFDDNLTSSDENFTKRSFDFTGELAKLNESGASDRRSFVEQLENAFKTPAKVDLRVDFGLGEVPPVPPMPLRRMQRQEEEEEEESYSAEAMGVGSRYEEEESDERASAESVKTSANSSSSPRFNDESVSRLMDMKQPSLELPSIKSSTSSNTATIAQLQLKKSMASVKSGRSARSNASGLSVDGELNRSFRFGGESEEMHDDKAVPKPMTLADIIPPPAHVRQVSFSSSMLDEYEDSALKSIVSSVQPVPSGAPAVQPRERTTSGASTQDPRLSTRLSAFIPLSRPASGVSFGGLDSFDEVRRGFEFHDYRPDFYTANTSNASSHASSARSRAHLRAQESVFSIASVSSYGRVIRDGAQDPFDFGMAPPLARLRERSFESEEEGDATDSMDFEMSTQVDDTFSFLNHRPAPRRRVDSDASSFYFTSPPVSALRPGHRRRESNMSVSSVSGLPPVSLWNRSFGMGHHRRSSSVTSASSVALSYAHGGIGGRAIMARHRRDASVDSVASEVSMSGRFMARPGLGEKMFGNESEHSGSLKAIAGSPSQSISGDMLSASDYGYNRTSGSSFDYYDSIIDGPEYRSGVSDSLFDRTGDVTSSVSSGSVFGDDYTGQVHGGLLPMHQFRPLSVISLGGPHSPMQDDDTMISMLGGGHVRRRSIGSMIDASPCVRMDKKNTHRRTARENSAVPTVNAKTVELKPSIASVSSFQFGGDRMIKARHGLLERQSLEESVLIAAGEDLSLSFQAAPVFTRPAPTSRSRSSTCSTSTSTSESSGRDTPPLSACDGYGSSISGASFSSIDTLDMNTALSNAMHPTSTLASARARARDHGHGHRRRYSKAHVSRSSVYETIEEELSSSSPSSDAESVYGSTTKKLLHQSPNDSTAVYVVGSDTESIHNPEECVWDDERGIVALRKFYHLKDEAQYTVQESQRMWMDTPFSLYAVQSFDPPRHPDGMKALLEHSVHTFGPLPAELRRMRSRKNSRPSPYPSTRFMSTIQASPAFERPAPSKLSTTSTVFESKPDSAPTPVLKEKKLNAKKLNVAPSLEVLKPMSPFAMKVTGDGSPKKAALGVNGAVRPRVPSAARRSALGWSKRSNGAKTSTDSKKENVVGEGSIVMTPGDSLRLNRPRPRGRTPASQARAIRI
ncbi:hypothetical protein DFP72DRAFT_1110853, partial [Ephemerocybe angulata]